MEKRDVLEPADSPNAVTLFGSPPKPEMCCWIWKRGQRWEIIGGGE